MLSETARYEFYTNLGALLLGNIMNAMLFGVTTVQTYAYWNTRSSDPIALVVLLLLTWLIDILQLAFFSFTTYTYAITDFGDPQASQKILWTLPVLIFLTGASDLIVRSIFCHRIRKLSQHNVILNICLLLSCVSTTGLDWAFAAMSVSAADFSVWRSTRFSIILYAGLTSAMVGDLLIAGSLCLILGAHMKEIPRSRTSDAIRVLIAYSIETGGLTSVCTLSCLITYATVSHNYVYLALYLLLSKFSLNALLATLNARRGLRALSAASEPQHASLPVFHVSTGNVNNSMGTQQQSTVCDHESSMPLGHSFARSEQSENKRDCTTQAQGSSLIVRLH